jgi:alcohol dehydrogenase class IV
MAHGQAIASLLPTVVRWNRSAAGNRYQELLKMSSVVAAEGEAAEMLARRLESLAEQAGLHVGLKRAGVLREELPKLAEEAAEQWTGRFNPRLFDVRGALEVYEWAF